ncbi:hypothetical protein [Frankia sp. AvcI1]|uniref:hypothetical protein n=1 Tax=Frankia sp. AvcI1 TaxID=573496 RepID=UPI000A5385B3|nr:hypothetical protein [Frankia sp. AvcI1]
MTTDPPDDRHRPAHARPAFPLGRRSRGHDHHPDVELLDAVAGGEPVTRSTRDHVETCPVCRESIAALRKVRADLSRLAAMTMPGDVAERIQAALAARMPPQPHPPHDPAARPGAEATTTDAPAPRPAPDAGRSPTGPTAAAPTGAPPTGASQTGAAQTGTPQTGARTRGGGPTGDTGGGGREIRPVRGPARIGPGRRPAARPERRPAPGVGAAPGWDWVSIAAVCAAFVTFGAAVLAFYGLRVVAADHPVAASSVAQGRHATAAAAGAGPGRLTMMADSRTTVAPADVGQHGRELLTGQIAGSVALPLPLTGPTGGAEADAAATGAVPLQAVAPAAARHPAAVVAAPPATAGQRLRTLLDTPDLRSCYQSLIAQSGGEILAVDLVRYDGQPALLVVLSIPMQPAAARVLVVDAHCGVVSVSAALWYSATTLRR